MTKQEALNWFQLRKKMCLSDRTQEAEDIAIECIATVIAHESRVLTLEEATEDECWFEYINGSCGNADVYMKDNKTAIIYRTNRRPVQVLITDYMKKWRCWSYRPTGKQRKEAKWDG